MPIYGALLLNKNVLRTDYPPPGIISLPMDRLNLVFNLLQLKSVVPELLDMDKASKLVILNKASNYCVVLANFNTRLTTEVNQESAKNAQLRKKLLEIQRAVKKMIRR